MIRLKIDQLKYSRFLARYISWTCYSYLTVTGVPNSFEGILIQSKSKHAFEKVRHRVCFVLSFYKVILQTHRALPSPIKSPIAS